MPEYAVKTTIYVQPVSDIREATQEAKDQLEIWSPQSEISHWRFHKTSEMSDSIGIVDAVIYTLADDKEEAEGNIDDQMSYISETKVTGHEVLGVRKVRSHRRRK